MSAIERLREQLHENPRILTVCTGNICRSPMAEVVLQQRLVENEDDDRLGDFSVEKVWSAGVSDEEHGNGIYPQAAEVLREHGYAAPKEHRAHQVSRDEMERSGLILAMTAAHARTLGTLAQQWEVPLERFHLWREFDGTGLGIAPHGCLRPGGALAPGSATPTSATDVPDPWYGPDSGFYATIETVEAGAEGLYAALDGDILGQP
ncbi:MAG: low molecular weight protein-tyrosine-phosphatase [Micrococcaceae bacterium]